MARLRVRKAELEEILSMSPDTVLTREMIAAKLKADAQSFRDGDIERLLKAYVDKIYAHSNEIIITMGVNIVGKPRQLCDNSAKNSISFSGLHDL